MATSPSLAHRVNCGQTAGLCYLSLPPDHSAEARGGEDNHASPPPVPLLLPHSLPSPILVRKLANGSQCLWAGLNLAESHVFQAEDKPLGAGGNVGPRGNEVPTDAHVTG